MMHKNIACNKLSLLSSIVKKSRCQAIKKPQMPYPFGYFLRQIVGQTPRSQKLLSPSILFDFFLLYLHAQSISELLNLN
jgi:hypothetical protein